MSRGELKNIHPALIFDVASDDPILQAAAETVAAKSGGLIKDLGPVKRFAIRGSDPEELKVLINDTLKDRQIWLRT